MQRHRISQVNSSKKQNHPSHKSGRALEVQKEVTLLYYMRTCGKVHCCMHQACFRPHQALRCFLAQGCVGVAVGPNGRASLFGL